MKSYLGMVVAANAYFCQFLSLSEKRELFLIGNLRLRRPTLTCFRFFGCLLMKNPNSFSFVFVLVASAPDYLIPLIASLVALVAMLALILCIRGKWRDRKRANREMRLNGKNAARKQRNPKTLSDGRKYYNQTSETTLASSTRPTSLQSTELRDIDECDSTPTCPATQVSPPLSPREEGERDEWRRFRVHRNSTQIEIIV